MSGRVETTREHGMLQTGERTAAGTSVETGMIAMILQKPDDAAERRLALDLLARAGVEATDASEEILRIGQTGARCEAVPRPGEVRSILAAMPTGSCRAVVVSPSLRLFEGPWTDRLLRQAAAAVAPGGRLVTGFQPDRVSAARGWPSRGFVEGVLGPAADSVAIDRVRALVHAPERGGPSASAAGPPTVLGFAFDALDELVAAFAGDDGGGDAPRGSTRTADADAFVSALNYSVVGAAYKAALLDRIIDHHRPGAATGGAAGSRSRLGGLRGVFGRGGLRWLTGGGAPAPERGTPRLRILDLGGGPALTLAELMLRRGDVASGVCVDPSPTNRDLVGHLVRWLESGPEPAQQVASRLAFDLATMEAPSGDGEVDVVSLIGSLLYVPREHTDAVLQRAWDRLSPGGLLVVHENLRDPAYVVDYDQMFTGEELEARLARLEPADRSFWLSSGTARIPAGEVGRQTVFRVLVKPS